MTNSIFNLTFQQDDIKSKIVVALERISEVFRALLWEHAKTIGLSPIQIQILIFIAYHQESLRNVSHLAKEFNVTKPTISDAVRVLEKKGLISKHPAAHDSRRYSIALTESGTAIVQQTENFAEPIKKQLQQFSDAGLSDFHTQLIAVISGLNRSGILSEQRTCHSCRFFEKNKEQSFCQLMKKPLLPDDIRLDCPEFEV
ncbi:MAG: MarR family transcriptional regulator, partial [Saprospiraceae bacterium]|nr:MarR family transcriptional regulator [Saprospiraceae bacterium]